MPYSMVLHVRLKEDCIGKTIDGAASHSAIKELLKQYFLNCDSGEMEEIIKSYSFSPLFTGERSLRPLSVETDVKSNRLCWFRISTLEEKYSNNVFHSFYQDIITNKITLLETEHGTLEFSRAILASKMHSWVESTSIEDLIANSNSEENEVLIEFASPTVFVYENMMTPLPIPQIFYKNLGKTWNKLVPQHQITEENIETLSKHVTLISFKNLCSNVQTIGPGKHRVGFTGRIRFRLIGTKDENIIKNFNLLTNSLFYTGCGKAIHLGCGMARRIARSKWELIREGINNPF